MYIFIGLGLFSPLFLLEKSKSSNFAILKMYFHSGHKLFGMWTNICYMCSNWKFPPGVKGKGCRQPNSFLVVLIKRFWPGYFTPLFSAPGTPMKIVYTWADYEAAPGIGYMTAVVAMTTKFWVSHISRSLFIVDDPNILS